MVTASKQIKQDVFPAFIPSLLYIEVGEKYILCEGVDCRKYVKLTVF